jgi:hypothetical protein
MNAWQQHGLFVNKFDDFLSGHGFSRNPWLSVEFGVIQKIWQ